MLDGLHRAVTGQTASKKELIIAGIFILQWYVMDVIQFIDFVREKL